LYILVDGLHSAEYSVIVAGLKCSLHCHQIEYYTAALFTCKYGFYDNSVLESRRSYTVVHCVSEKCTDFETVYSVSPKNPPMRFSDIFPKRMGIFKSIFTHLLYVSFYFRLQIFIQLSPTLTKLCHTKRYHPTNFYISLEV